MVKYRQAIAIIDTADPILFRFPPRADNGDIAVPSRRHLEEPPSLAEASAAMQELKQSDAGVSTVGASEAGTVVGPTTEPSIQTQTHAQKTHVRASDFGKVNMFQEVERNNDEAAADIATVSSEKDPNQLELPMNVESEEQTCAA